MLTWTASPSFGLTLRSQDFLQTLRSSPSSGLTLRSQEVWLLLLLWSILFGRGSIIGIISVVIFISFCF